jgi:hypothetical protein
MLKLEIRQSLTAVANHFCASEWPIEAPVATYVYLFTSLRHDERFDYLKKDLIRIIILCCVFSQFGLLTFLRLIANNTSLRNLKSSVSEKRLASTCCFPYKWLTPAR